MELTKIQDKSKLRRDWSKEAISLALQGEWQRAAEVNQAILALHSDDVDAMNRLGKAFMELNEYGRAREVLARLVAQAPYNTIAKKNLIRLEQLESIPATSKQVRRTGGAPRLFIAESGKSGTTVLQKPAAARMVASVAPGEPANLVVENQAIRVYVRDGEYLGQVEPRLARRLQRLIDGGNRYEAAIIGVNDWGISLVIRETYRHPSLHNICSFPTSGRGERRVYLDNDLLRYLEESELDEDEDDAVSYGNDGDGESEWDE